MAFDPRKVKAAIDSGLSPVCATCRKHWEAQDQGRATCTLPGETCGGPISGMDFPLYDGPMTRLDKFCFACVKPADFVIRPFDADRLVGVCKGHLRLIDRLEVTEIGHPSLSVISTKGIVAPVGGRYTPKTVAELMHEDETKWAAEDAARAKPEKKDV